MSLRRGNARVRTLLLAIAAIAVFLLGGWVAAHHPLAPIIATAAFVVACGIAFFLPGAAFFMLSALLPLAGLATWTGWIVVDEFDLLALAVIAGRYAAMALDAAAQPAESRIPAPSVALIALFLASVCASAVRGYFAAGGAGVDWFAGYYDALNSLRIAKPFLLALLTLAALRPAVQRHGDGILDCLMAGCATGLALTAAAIVWERAAFVGLLDFSSDYRATALFWEMHVGGAALDGFLALTVPFGVRAWARARTPAGIAVTNVLMIVAGYACLATFSRGVYVALPIALAALMLLTLPRGSTRHNGVIGYGMRMAGAAAVTILAAWLTFRHGGYRSLAAMLGALVVALSMAPAIRGIPMPRLLAAGIAGMFAAALAAVVAAQVAKGAYVLYGALLASAVVMAVRLRTTSGAGAHTAAIACTGGLGAAVVAVAMYWGGAAAAVDSALALVMFAAVVTANARFARPLWRDDLRSLSLAVGVALGLSGTVAVFVGGAYMEGRLAASKTDLELRLAHWRQVIHLLRTPEDWLFGKGLGSLPASYFYGAESGEFPGSYRLEGAAGERYVALSGPRHPSGLGDWLRFAQRVPKLTAGFYRVRLDARAERPVVLQVEVCEKHLLYNAGCAAGSVEIKATYPAWQAVVMQLDGSEIVGGPWYAPRLAFLSIAVAGEGLRADIDNVSVTGDDGRGLIVNGDFSDGLSRWFFTSDNEHLPWHAKNLALNVLFDQGIVGLVLFAALVAGAIGRLVLVLRDRAEAPFIVSSLVGFVAVGAFDSLLDVPRVAFLFYLLACLGLTLSRVPSASGSGPRA